MAEARRARRPIAPTYGTYARATTGRRGAARAQKEGAWRIPLPGLRGALLLATLAAVAGAAVWLLKSPYFTVTEVRVVGAKSLDPQAVREASGLLGQNVFDLDLAGARARVLALPNVADAQAQRVGLNAVRIRVVEREAWALWQVQGRRYAIDTNGYVLDRTLPDEGAPVIVNTDAVEAPKPGDRVDPGAVELVRTLTGRADALGARIQRWEYRQRDGLTAVLDGGLRVTFGDSRDMDYKLAALEALLAEADREGLGVQAVDLRFGDRLSFR
ncbi:MAG TPA: cell division protein FtsQ/DivIB [Dehalococcoidia bacterium]|nr:cell division protein FtsQ/DivIB [Dehalococcoidia bacterium]